MGIQIALGGRLRYWIGLPYVRGVHLGRSEYPYSPGYTGDHHDDQHDHHHQHR